MAKKHKSEHEKGTTQVLEPKRLGLTFGILKGACLGLLSILAMLTGWGSPVVRLLGSLFLGYEATLPGLILGLIWGFAIGFIVGYKAAWLYNKLGEKV